MRIRVALSLGVVVVLAQLALVRGAEVPAGLIRLALAAGRDPITVAEGRFRWVMEALPARGVYGFRALGPLTIDRDQEIEGDDRSSARDVSAQYVLAPRLLDVAATRGIVIREGSDGVRVTSGEGR